MVEVTALLRLAGPALGALGATLLFVEFFQVPNYVDYNAEFGSYSFDLSPDDVQEYSWFGRAGALLVALSFALRFLSAFL